MSTEAAAAAAAGGGGAGNPADPAWNAYQQNQVPSLPVGAVPNNLGDPIPQLPNIGNQSINNGAVKTPEDDEEDDDEDDDDDLVVSTSKYQIQWNANLSNLKKYKEEHGHTNCTRTEDKVLGRWVNNQRAAYKSLVEGKHTSLTPERVEELIALGFEWTRKAEDVDDAGVDIRQLVKDYVEKNPSKRGRAMDDETWSIRLQQLKTFKETKKHLRVPASTERGTKRPRAAGEEVDEETAKLGKWVKRQRRAFSTGKLAPERKAALDEIGFDFSPGAASKDERLAVQLGLLDELRKRRELSNAQVQDLNFLHGEWSRRGDQISKPVLGAAKGSTGKGGNKFNIKWQESFEQLKEFSIKNGHTRVPQKHPDDKDGINPLGKWVDYQRQQYWKRMKGIKVSLDEDRIALLESIGFEWRLRMAAPDIQSMDLQVVGASTELKVDEDKAYAAVFVQPKEKEDGVTVNDYRWKNHYEEMKRYKELLGTSTIKNKKHPIYGTQLTSLNKWANHQRREFKKRMKGEKGGLSDSKTRRLEAIGFDFDPNAEGKPVAFRGWDAKLNMLKAFQQKYGNCRVPVRKKKGEDDTTHDAEMFKLAKWVEHQRSMYWKRQKGEKTPLSDARVAALNAIGMEWRLIGTAGMSRSPAPAAGSQATTKSEEAGMKNELPEAVVLSPVPILPPPDVAPMNNPNGEEHATAQV